MTLDKYLDLLAKQNYLEKVNSHFIFADNRQK